MPIRFFDIDGLRVRCRDDGEGPAVLFLHGWGVSFEQYAVLLDHLAGTHRVIAPDLPGAGQSQEPPVPWDARAYADFILRFSEAAGLSEAILIGHSHGGRTVIKLLSAPHEPLIVKKAVLMDSAGLRPKRGPAYYLRVYSYKAVKLLLSPFPSIKARFTARAGSADYRAASPVMRGTLSKLVAEDMTPLLPRIRSSVLLIWGDRDTATPLAHAKVMEKAIPGAGLVTLKGAGHWACLERWDVCVRVLDSFLSDNR